MRLSILVFVIGCRFGFDLAPGDGGDGVGDSSTSGDAMSVADCTNTTTTLVVTTAADEADTVESPTPPHAGAGLSLREAITSANLTAGRECVMFAAPMTIAVGSRTLPALIGTDGLVIDGSTVVAITGNVGWL